MKNSGHRGWIPAELWASLTAAGNNFVYLCVTGFCCRAWFPSKPLLGSCFFLSCTVAFTRGPLLVRPAWRTLADILDAEPLGFTVALAVCRLPQPERRDTSEPVGRIMEVF